MIPTKTEQEIDLIRSGGKVLLEIFSEIEEYIRPGIDTAEIDKRVEDLMRKKKVLPAFKGYRGYQHATCISVNEEIVHGIPGRRRLEEADIVSLDIGVIVSGYYADSARTFACGLISKKAKKLIAATKKALTAGIRQARAGNHLGDIGAAIDAAARKSGFNVVRDLFGHGIGKKLHEDPLIPNFGRPNEGVELKAGMVFALEPMLNVGSHKMVTLDDGWTIVTEDGGLSAHFEHTIVVRDGKAEVLTSA